jgi:hypothetical protein
MSELEVLIGLLNEVKELKNFLMQFEVWVFGIGVGVGLIVFSTALIAFRSNYHD